VTRCGLRFARAGAAVVAVASAAFLVPTHAAAVLEPLTPSANQGVVAGPASTFHSVSPFAAFVSKHRVAPGHPVPITLAATRGLPAAGGFDAVALSVTVSQATKPTTATVSPADASSPIPVVTAPAKRPVAGFVVVPVDAAGAIQAQLAGGHARLRVVVEGYQTAGAGGTTYHSLVAATMLAAHRLGAGATKTVTIRGAPRTGLPPNGHIAAVALAVTVAHPSAKTTVTAFPRGRAVGAVQPLVSASSGVVASGVGIVKVGKHGDVTLRNAHGHATLSAAVEGYWTADPTGASFRSVAPRVLYDGTSSAHAWRSVTVAGRAGLPLAGQVSAAVLSITAGPPSGSAYLDVAPAKRGNPSTGPISVAAHRTVTTTVLARLTSPKVRIYANRRMSLTVRVVGWYGDTAAGIDLSASPNSCSSPLPTGAAFAVIRATNGQPFHAADSTCFTTDAIEAAQLPAAPEYYLNLADPGKASAGNWDNGGPKACHVAHDFDAGCAYDYGYEAALQAVGFAIDHGMAAGSRWWIDVEPGNSWGSHDLALPGHAAANTADIRGALHYLSSHGLPAGIYTETDWWIEITGAPSGFAQVPVWGGGADSRAYARDYCKAVSITGGPALLAQWFTTVASDHDVAC
jgi:hypothetical protein